MGKQASQKRFSPRISMRIIWKHFRPRNRAVNAYYIATAKHVNAALITNYRVMKHNALKVGVKAYYLLNDNDYSALISKLMIS